MPFLARLSDTFCMTSAPKPNAPVTFVASAFHVPDTPCSAGGGMRGKFAPDTMSAALRNILAAHTSMVAILD